MHSKPYQVIVLEQTGRHTKTIIADECFKTIEDAEAYMLMMEGDNISFCCFAHGKLVQPDFTDWEVDFERD